MIATIVAIVGAIVGVWSLVSSNIRIKTFESNCIATLKADVRMLKDNDEHFRDDITSIFEKLDRINERLSYLEGRTNIK